MSLSEAFLMAAAFTAICICFIGEKIVEVDFSGLLPKNLKKSKYKRLLAEHSTPLQGTALHAEIKNTFEQILLPLGTSDKSLLPTRMDMTFRRKIEQQIDNLARRKLYRDIRLTDVVPLPKNNFSRWNDDGREWREATLQCSILERLISSQDGRIIHQNYCKNGFLRVLQSRHVRNSDRKGKKKNYYADRVKINCPSCSAQVQLVSQQTVCPYCGGVIQSDFYDWQTEAFEIYEKIGTNLQRMFQLLMAGTILFVSVFLCLWLIPDKQVSLAAGVGTATLIFVLILVFVARHETKQEKLSGKIIRYSENYLRSCINEALYREENNMNLMDYNIGRIILKKVINTEETTEITVRVYISETYIPEKKKPYTRKYKRNLTLRRARYPRRRKGDASFFTEKECPSCGGNFIPDENQCCSFCGYSLQTDNAKWTIWTTSKKL